MPTMSDPTEADRRRMLETNQPAIDFALATQWWTTDELRRDFDVLGFMAPFVAVRRKADGVKGAMEFTHHPRFYFNFVEDRR